MQTKRIQKELCSFHDRFRGSLTDPSQARSLLFRTILVNSILIFALLSSVPRIHSNPLIDTYNVVAGLTPEKWKTPVPTKTCYGSTDTNCHFGSPVLADINDDGFLDSVVVTTNGHIVALNHNGSLLWDTDVAPFFGMAANTHEIHSSPAVADIDQDGFPEIVVGAGTLNGNICTQGGLVVLSHTGNIEPGWPFLAVDEDIPPEGCRDSIYSSPALGDLDKDGDLEIVAAGFDKRIYAWHHNGALVAGFPPNSSLHDRFPTWPNLEGKLADNTWGSPALADLNGDGYLEIVIGTGEGNFDARWGGDANGWTCPYTLPDGWAPGYCGGSVYALDRFGNIIPGFPKYILEAIGSSPAIADINADGRDEIFIGTSDFYYNYSPDHPTYGFMLMGLDGNGNNLPGWPQSLGGGVTMSPAIGDITGDSQPEIVVIATDKKLYAWHQNGSPVSGFPMTPLDLWGSSSTSFNLHTGLILADTDGDVKMEIVFNQGGNVNIVDGNGQQLTGTNFPNNTKPIYYAEGSLINTPAAGDIDNDGRLELVAMNSTVYTWDLPDAGSKADWPMFRQNAARTGRQALPMLHVTPASLVALHETGDSSDVVFSVVLAGDGSEPIDWTANESHPDIFLSSTSGILMDATNLTITIDRSGLVPGKNTLGSVLVTGTINGQDVVNSPASLPVTVYIVDRIHEAYLPAVIR